MRVNRAVPLVWRLLKAVEGLFKFTNVVGLSWGDVALGLVDVDLFGEIRVQEG